jgi:glutathione synthase/RimK-type ligase-like ATP-grasp enzyme
MKIAIHKSPIGFFSKRWIKYCKENDIPYKVVNAYDSNIIEKTIECTAFMWHFSNYDNKDSLFAKQLLYSLQSKGLNVFPNFSTCWHFDDKVGQKYLLEAVNAPLVPSYIFYSKKEAKAWIKKTTFPKVFKLRGGSGSSNVKLVKTQNKAKRLVNKAFGSGFPQFDRWNHLKYRYKNFQAGKENFLAVLKGIARLFIGTAYSKQHSKERGYIYFQDFIPNNKFDIRIVVINEKAFAIKRLVRKDDFRASGSGFLIYNREEIDERCVSIALNINSKIESQCTAYDFIFDKNNDPLIVEISYGFVPEAYDKCEGYWDIKLKWYKGKFNPYGWMVDNLIS